MDQEQAKQWVEQWKSAAPKLQAIRDAELRAKSRKGVESVDGHVIFERNPERNGLVIMQQWLMLRAAKEQVAGKRRDATRDEPPQDGV